MLRLEVDVDGFLLLARGVFLLLVLFYIFWDVHYFFRMFFTMWYAKLFQSRLKIDETGVIYGMSFTCNVDLFSGCMSEARYIRELDFARLDFCERTGFRPSITKDLNATVLQSINFIAYEQSIPLFTFYKITTKLVHWDERALYLEHRCESLEGEVMYGTVFSRLNVLGMNVHEMVSDLAARDPALSPAEAPTPLQHLRRCAATFSHRLRHAETVTQSSLHTT